MLQDPDRVRGCKIRVTTDPDSNQDYLTIISCSADETLRVWDLSKSLHEPQKLRKHTGQVTCLEVTYVDDQAEHSVRDSLRGKTKLLSCANDRSIFCWDLDSGEWEQKLTPSKDGTDKKLEDHKKITGCCMFHDEQGPKALCSTGDGRLVVFDMDFAEREREEMDTLCGHGLNPCNGKPMRSSSSTVTGCCVLKHEEHGWLAVSCGKDCTIRIWDLSKHLLGGRI